MPCTLTREQLDVILWRIKSGNFPIDPNAEILNSQTQESVVQRIQEAKENTIDDEVSGRKRYLGVKPHKRASDVYSKYAINKRGLLTKEHEEDTPGTKLRIAVGQMMDNSVSLVAMEYAKLSSEEKDKAYTNIKLRAFAMDAIREEMAAAELEIVDQEVVINLAATAIQTVHGLWAQVRKLNNDVLIQMNARSGNLSDIVNKEPHLETQLLVLDPDRESGGYTDLTFILADGSSVVIDIKTKLAKNRTIGKMVKSDDMAVNTYAGGLAFRYEQQLETYGRGMQMYLSKVRKSFVLPIMVSAEYNEKTGEFEDTIYGSLSLYQLKDQMFLNELKDQDITSDELQRTLQEWDNMNAEHRLSLINTQMSKTMVHKLNKNVARIHDFTKDFFTSTDKIFQQSKYEGVPYARSRMTNYRKMIDKLVNYADVNMLKSQMESFNKDYARLQSDLAKINDRIADLSFDERNNYSLNIRLLQTEGQLLAGLIDGVKEYAKELNLSEELIQNLVKDGHIEEGAINYTRALEGFENITAGEFDNILVIIKDLSSIRQEFDRQMFNDTLEIDQQGLLISPDIGTITAWTDNLLYINHPVFDTARQRIKQDRWEIKDRAEKEIQRFFETQEKFFSAMKKTHGLNKQEAMAKIANGETGLLIEDLSKEFHTRRERLLLNYLNSKEDEKVRNELATFMTTYYEPTPFFKEGIEAKRERTLENIYARYFEIIPKEDISSTKDFTIRYNEDIGAWIKLHASYYLAPDFYDAYNQTLEQVEAKAEELAEAKKNNPSAVSVIEGELAKLKKAIKGIETDDGKWTGGLQGMYRDAYNLTMSQISSEYLEWQRMYDLTSKNPAVGELPYTNEANMKFLRPKKVAREEFPSEDFKIVEQAGPDAIAYLDRLYAFNSLAESVYNRKLPRNFIPNFRAEVTEKVAQHSRAGNIKQIFTTTQQMIMAETQISSEDSTTDISFSDNRKLKIQEFGVPALIDSDGDFYEGETENDIQMRKRNADLKSLNLEAVYPMFIQGIVTHEILSRSEAYGLALLDLVRNPDQMQIMVRNRNNAPMVNKAVDQMYFGDISEDGTISDNSKSNLYKALNTLVNWHWYNQRYAGDKWINFTKGDSQSGIGPVNSKKVLLYLQRIYSTKILGFGILPGAGALFAGLTSGFINSFEGEFMSKKTYLKMLKMMTNPATAKKFINKARNMSMGFETVNQPAEKRVQYRRLPKIEKIFSSWGLYAPYHFADNVLAMVMTAAVADFHTVDENGKLIKMKNAPEGAVSIWDQFEHDEDVEDFVELTDEEKKYREAFQRRVRQVNMETYGQLPEGDLAMYQTKLLGTMLGMFKTWLPQLAYKRFRKAQYVSDLDAIRQGRYVSWAQQMWPKLSREKQLESQEDYFERANEDDGNNILQAAAMFTVGSAWTLINNVDIMWNSERTPRKLNRQRMEVNYRQWEAANPMEARRLGDTFDERFAKWEEMVENNIRGAIAELYTILTFYVGLAALRGDYDDDSDLTENYTLRQMYKVANKARSEILFFLNANEAIRMVKSPLPIIGLAEDVIKTMTNGVDEISDLTAKEVFNKKIDNRDKTPLGYYSTRWIPGVYQLRKLAEIFEQDRRSYYEN